MNRNEMMRLLRGKFLCDSNADLRNTPVTLGDVILLLEMCGALDPPMKITKTSTDEVDKSAR